VAAEDGEEIFPGVTYPNDLNIRQLFTIFPLRKEELTGQKKCVLIGFLEANDVSFKESHSKDILY